MNGSAPAEARVVLLLIDVINDLEFEGGEKLLAPALAMAGPLAALKRRARSGADLTPSDALDLERLAPPGGDPPLRSRR